MVYKYVKKSWSQMEITKNCNFQESEANKHFRFKTKNTKIVYTLFLRRVFFNSKIMVFPFSSTTTVIGFVHRERGEEKNSSSKKKNI
jgi:hypothetical protein